MVSLLRRRKYSPLYRKSLTIGQPSILTASGTQLIKEDPFWDASRGEFLPVIDQFRR
jgi:hypothetical protein